MTDWYSPFFATTKEEENMKICTIIVSAALACALGAVPAFAQTAQQDMEQYISSHPELQQNPSLIHNPNYLDHHRDLAHFLQTHPNLNRQGNWTGAYDQDHVWRNEDWWHTNNPTWMYDHHPQWAEAHPDWGNDGDFDDAHHWHERRWWAAHHPDWVRDHHPGWGTDNDQPRGEAHRYDHPGHPHHEAFADHNGGLGGDHHGHYDHPDHQDHPRHQDHPDHDNH